jgi:hypothetical protein
VHVDVDQARRNIESRDVERVIGRILDARSDPRHAAVADGDVHNPVAAIGRVDHMPTLQHQVVLHTVSFQTPCSSSM